jgi:hypothetical protein
MAGNYITYSQPPLVVGEVSATATATTTSATAALLTGMTTTLPIGTYLIWFSASCQSNGTNSTAQFGLFVGGTLKADSERISQPYDGGTLAAPNATGGVAINALITLTASTVVQIEWLTTGGTSICNERTMNWLKVG